MSSSEAVEYRIEKLRYFLGLVEFTLALVAGSLFQFHGYAPHSVGILLVSLMLGVKVQGKTSDGLARGIASRIPKLGGYSTRPLDEWRADLEERGEL